MSLLQILLYLAQNLTFDVNANAQMSKVMVRLLPNLSVLLRKLQKLCTGLGNIRHYLSIREPGLPCPLRPHAVQGNGPGPFVAGVCRRM